MSEQMDEGLIESLLQATLLLNSIMGNVEKVYTTVAFSPVSGMEGSQY